MYSKEARRRNEEADLVVFCPSSYCFFELGALGLWLRAYEDGLVTVSLVSGLVM